MKKGFTTIELLVVLAILAIILSFSTGNILRAIYGARFRSFLDEASSLIKKAYLMTKDEEVVGKYFIKIESSGSSDLQVELVEKKSESEKSEKVLEKVKGKGISLKSNSPKKISFTPDGTILCDGNSNFVELTFFQKDVPDSDKTIKIDSIPPGSVEVIGQVSE